MVSELSLVVQVLERHITSVAPGEITLGHLDAIGRCIATATDDTQCPAMLVRREDESLDTLLQRLDAAIVDAYKNEHFTDEINAPIPSGS